MIIILDSNKIINIIGVVLIIVGLIPVGFNTAFCYSMCEYCTAEKLMPCFNTFIFVGIIFIVNGASLILIEIKNRKTEKQVWVNE